MSISVYVYPCSASLTQGLGASAAASLGSCPATVPGTLTLSIWRGGPFDFPANGSLGGFQLPAGFDMTQILSVTAVLSIVATDTEPRGFPSGGTGGNGFQGGSGLPGWGGISAPSADGNNTYLYTSNVPGPWNDFSTATAGGGIGDSVSPPHDDGLTVVYTPYFIVTSKGDVGGIWAPGYTGTPGGALQVLPYLKIK